MSGTEDIQSTVLALKKRVLFSDPTQQHQGDLLQTLKRQSRQLHEAAHQAKEAVSSLRKQQDAAYLALQSVHYEKKHLEQELAQCLSTEIYDTVDFAEPQKEQNGMDRKEAMDNKLNRLKQEVVVRQGRSLESCNMKTEQVN